MTNLLPEKLTTLRKRYHYAQGDIAARINVPVSEYMKWENGSALCRIEQLILLADLFRVPLQALVDNTVVLDLPDPEHDYDGIEIPSFSGNVKGTGVELDEAQAQEILYGMPSTGDSVEIPLSDDVTYRQMKPAPAGDTVKLPAVKEEPLSNTREFASTRVIKISDIQAPVPVRTPEKEPEEDTKGSRKALYVIIAVILALAAGVMRMLGNRGAEDPVLLDVTREDRLVLGDRFSGYVSDQYRLTTMGTTAELTGFTDLVKISAGPDTLMGLKRDGTAVVTGNYDVSEWDHLVDIAAGERHICALKDDGTVVCTGSDAACEVSSWTGISSVYAGKDLTAGLSADGVLYVSGSGTLAEALEKSQVKDLALSSEGAAVLYRDGTMETFGNLSALKPQMNGAVSVAAGNAFVAVLDSAGNVRVFCADREYGKEAEKWSGIQYIAARGKTLVALSQDGRIIGLGDNFYNVYNKDSSADPVEKTKLAQVSNVQFSVTVSGLVINWDTVPNAKYYEVVVSTQPQTKMNSAANSARISDDKLVDGQTYTVTITPHPSDKDLYEDGDPVELTYTYSAAQIQLDAPQNVRVKLEGTSLTISWDKVNKADYYNVAVETMVQKVTGTTITLDATHLTDDKKYTVYVTALSNNARYTESNGGQADFTYKAPVVTVKLPTPEITTLNVEDNNDWTITWKPVEGAAAYKVSVGDMELDPTTQTSVRISADRLTDGMSYKIRITAMPADTAKYDNSDTARETHTYTAHQPEPTESPEPTDSPEPKENPEPTDSPEPSEEPGGEETDG